MPFYIQSLGFPEESSEHLKETTLGMHVVIFPEEHCVLNFWILILVSDGG